MADVQTVDPGRGEECRAPRADTAGPIVVLPLLCGVFASAVAMVVTDHCRRWFAVLAVALALTMVLMGLAAAGVWAALTGASALRPIVLGAMALVAAELVLDRGLPTVRRVVICVAVASSCAILLFQPIETSFGSWPTRRRRPPGRRRAGRNRIRIRGWEP